MNKTSLFTVACLGIGKTGATSLEIGGELLNNRFHFLLNASKIEINTEDILYKYKN